VGLGASFLFSPPKKTMRGPTPTAEWDERGGIFRLRSRTHFWLSGSAAATKKKIG
jgi:hypothetical protein